MTDITVSGDVEDELYTLAYELDLSLEDVIELLVNTSRLVIDNVRRACGYDEHLGIR